MALEKGKQFKDRTIAKEKIVLATLTTAEMDVSTGVQSTINAGDAAVQGTAAGVSPKDHQHAVATAAPSTNLAPDSTNAEGVSSSLARADHSHAPSMALVGEIADIGTVTAVGSSNKFADAGHVHKLASGSVPDTALQSGAKQSTLESKLLALWNQVTNFSASGGSGVVTTQVEAAAAVDTEQNSPTTGKGILTTGTTPNDATGTAVQNYKVQLQQNSNGDPVDDGAGGEVYGVLSENVGVWTLTYYKQDGTAYSFAAPTAIDFIFAEVFDLYSMPSTAMLKSAQFGDLITSLDHNHDDRYFTESEIGSATASSGSDLVGDDNTYSNISPSATTVKAALSALDTALAVSPASHASRHITSGQDLIDGDKLDVTFTPTNYTPDASPAEADDVDDLTAHLKGIDTKLGTNADTEIEEEFTGAGIVTSGADLKIADLANTPKAGRVPELFVNGHKQRNGTTKDFKIINSTEVWWLPTGGTGTAEFDLASDDIVTVRYKY